MGSLHLVTIIDTLPRQAVTIIDSARAAQITARLLAELCPGHSYGVQIGAAFDGPDCHPCIRDCARSLDVQCLIKKEMDAEQRDNPKEALKWNVYFYDNGIDAERRFQINGYLDHDYSVNLECQKDPTLAARTAWFGDGLTTRQLESLMDEFIAGVAA